MGGTRCQGPIVPLLVHLGEIGVSSLDIYIYTRYLIHHVKLSLLIQILVYSCIRLKCVVSPVIFKLTSYI